VPHRTWLKDNGIDFSQYEQEIKYQEFNSRYKLVERAKAVRMTRAVNSKVEEVEGSML